MPFPKNHFTACFRRSYACSMNPSSSNPRPHWTCRVRRLSSTSSADQKQPYPEPPKPHYFDSYTGTWSPRKIPLTPTARRSGVWSPRQIASRIGTPGRRPATPIVTTTGGAVEVDGVATNPPTTVPVPETRTWSLRRPATPGARPPSRGKNPTRPTTPSPLNTRFNHNTGLSWHHLPNANENHFQTYPFAEQPLDPADGSWVVTRVPLMESDARPRSRDWAVQGGGWGVISDVIEENGEGEGGNGGRNSVEQGMKGEGESTEDEGVRVMEKVVLPAVVHEMTVLPAIERGSVVG